MPKFVKVTEDSFIIHKLEILLIVAFCLKVVGVDAMKNWQGIPTTRLTLGGEVMVR